MIKVIPVTLRAFGLSMSFLLPGTRGWAFIIGILFWIIMGPIIRWSIRRFLDRMKYEIEIRKGENILWQPRK